MVLFGHPTGNPNSHHAALAHFEAGRLAAFCVPWMPSDTSLKILAAFPPLQKLADRLARRRFEPLIHAPIIQGRLGELRRLFLRLRGRDDEGLAYEANDWLMRTMKRECRRAEVTAVHAYEDCSLCQFEEAKRLGKACIYDMPIGFYPWWEEKQRHLAKEFGEWLPPGGLPSNRWVRPRQKLREMELADIVLAPSSFVKETILQFYPNKNVALAPYGVDLEFWRPKGESRKQKAEMRFIYAGQCSIRKGTPVLLEAWAKAELKDAELRLVGTWGLSDSKRVNLPAGATYAGLTSREGLRREFNKADVLVFPTFFEGRALVVGEALACGLPVVTTEASGMTDVVDATCGWVLPTGDVDALVEMLRWFRSNQEKLATMKFAARARAETCTWVNYRRCVSEAVIMIS
jgi:glycosyltransferase involved in cell wall biosynthesis